jgi:hypothetical protein
LKKSLILAIVGIIAIAAAVIFALSQPRELVNPITVTTDKSYYQTANPATIMVTIHVKPQVYKEGEKVQLQIVNENRTVLESQAIIDVQPDVNMTYPLKLGGRQVAAGEYWVIATYGNVDAQTSFQYEGFKTNAVSCQQFSLCVYQLTVGNSTYPINFRMNGTIESMTADLPVKVLTLSLKPLESTASLQIAIPREVLDARAGSDGMSGADEDFVIFVDETPMGDVSEFSTKEGTWAKDLGISENPEKFRILAISIKQGTETLEIVGTWPI